MQLSQREISSMIVALRLAQNLEDAPQDGHRIASISEEGYQMLMSGQDPLSADEIDALCQKLNLGEEQSEPRRIRCTDDLGNITYLIPTPKGEWRCVLSNGTPASFFYAVGALRDEMAFKFSLESSGSDDKRLSLLRNRFPDRSFELV